MRYTHCILLVIASVNALLKRENQWKHRFMPPLQHPEKLWLGIEIRKNYHGHRKIYGGRSTNNEEMTPRKSIFKRGNSGIQSHSMLSLKHLMPFQSSNFRKSRPKSTMVRAARMPYLVGFTLKRKLPSNKQQTARQTLRYIVHFYTKGNIGPCSGDAMERKSAA
jgi:hypothetical protein